MYADYFVTAVVTGGLGMLSFLLIERDTPGLTVRKVDIRESDVSGTAYLDFDECRVPVANLIGKENRGFKLIMYNFNHERMYVSACAVRLARVCLEESMKYALQRTAFGKRLADIQSIRMKLAAMARQIEQLQSWLEFVVYQMCTMSHQEANEKAGDVIGLVKVQASKVLWQQLLSSHALCACS
jgi:alkylation response protein AidB-like acyl-CoA dehydrogenase